MRIEHVAAAYMLVASHLKMTPKDAGSILVGFINGLSKEDHLNEIQTCIDGAENLEAEIVDAIDKIGKMDITDLIAGFTELVKVVSDLQTEVKTCEAIQGDITRIENWAKIFENPTALVATVTKNLISHYGAVTKDIAVINTDLTNAQYEPAGEVIADLAIQVLGEIPTEQVEIEKLEITMW